MYLGILTDPQRQAFICLAHSVIVSDGEFTESERRMLTEMRREMSLADDTEGYYVPIEGMAQTFETERSRMVALLALVMLSYADGAFDIEERCYLDDLRRELRVSDQTFSQIQSLARRAVSLEKEAQALLD